MAANTDPQRRPLFVDRVNQRLLADPAIGGSPWPVVTITPGMFADLPGNTVLGRSGTSGTPSALSADVVIQLVNTATSAVIDAARLTAASTTQAGVVQLESSTSSTSTSRAATASAVKAAYDLASDALPKAGGTVTGAVTLAGQSPLRFGEAVVNGNHSVALQAPAAIAADVTLTLPAADGAAGQALSTNGAGALGWTAYASLSATQSFTAAQRGSVAAQGSVSGTVTLDFALANHFSMTLPAGGTVTLANPSNLTAGQSGAITVTQNGSTAATVAFGSYWKFDGGAPSMSSALGAVSTLFYYVDSATRITAQLINNPSS